MSLINVKLNTLQRPCQKIWKKITPFIIHPGQTGLIGVSGCGAWGTCVGGKTKMCLAQSCIQIIILIAEAARGDRFKKQKKQQQTKTGYFFQMDSHTCRVQVVLKPVSFWENVFKTSECWNSCCSSRDAFLL